MSQSLVSVLARNNQYYKEGINMANMTLAVAQARAEIVRLRNLAAWQRGDYAQSHYRQAERPIYPGQDMICIGKAQQAERLADANDAQADIVQARIDAGVIV